MDARMAMIAITTSSSIKLNRLVEYDLMVRVPVILRVLIGGEVLPALIYSRMGGGQVRNPVCFVNNYIFFWAMAEEVSYLY